MAWVTAEHRPEAWPTRSHAILAAWIAGAPSFPPWAKQSAADRDAAHLVAARRQARQSMGDGPHDDARRRASDLGARYVRAFLSHRLWREICRICRCLH